jgi:hypothetical protein
VAELPALGQTSPRAGDSVKVIQAVRIYVDDYADLTAWIGCLMSVLLC